MDYKHQTVKVIGYTKPVIEGVETPQELIAYMARVSNPSNQLNMKTSEGLLKYCARNSHWSIFQMANLQFEICTTRDIARQLLRHDSLKFQEYSQRYADPTKDLGFVIREARFQDQKNRQNSVECNNPQIMAFWEQYQQKVIDVAKEAYTWAVENNIAKEQARVVLPEGNTESRLYVNANVRSIIHYCNLRRGNGSQLEHVDLANKIWNASIKYFPFLLKVDDHKEEN